MVANQAGLSMAPPGSEHGTLQEVQKPCVHQPILSYRLLLTWAAIPSWVGATLFPAHNGLVLPDLVVLSLKSRCTWPRPPPSYAAAEPCASGNDEVHRGTNVDDDTYLLLHLPFMVTEPALAGLEQVLAAGKLNPLLLTSLVHTLGNP
jgi:hypothetical protein